MINSEWNKSKIDETVTDIKQCYNEIFTYTVNLINEYHSITEEKDYYHLILGDWLMFLIHQSYIKWNEDQCSYSSNEKIIVKISPGFEEYHVYRLTDDFNHNLNFLISLFNDKKNINEYIDIQKIKHPENNFRKTPLTKIKKLFDNKFFNLKNKELIVFERMRRNSHFDFYKKTIKWNSWMGIKSSNQFNLSEKDIDKKWRIQNLNLNKEESSFNSFIKTIIPLFIPQLIVESFLENKNRIMLNNLNRPKFIYSATGLYSNEFKILAAEWKKRGTKFLYHQHGGNYGLDFTHWFEEYEIGSADIYYTWGWKSNEYNKDIKSLCVPSIKIKDRKKTRILLSVTDYPISGHRIHYQPMGSERVNIMHNETLDFIKNVGSNYPLDVRLPIKNYTNSISDKIKNSNHVRAIDSTRSNRYNMPYSYTLGISIAVHSYLCTSWLETIGLDIPTICFYDAEIYKFKESANKIIDKLEQVGILHKTGKSAALFLLSLGTNVDNWWNESDTVSARLLFKSSYANFSNKWYIDWEEEFLKVINK